MVIYLVLQVCPIKAADYGSELIFNSFSMGWENLKNTSMSFSLKQLEGNLLCRVEVGAHAVYDHFHSIKSSWSGQP